MLGTLKWMSINLISLKNSKRPCPTIPTKHLIPITEIHPYNTRSDNSGIVHKRKPCPLFVTNPYVTVLEYLTI